MRGDRLLFDLAGLLEIGFNLTDSLQRLRQNAPPALAAELADSERRGTLEQASWVDPSVRPLLGSQPEDLSEALRLASRMLREKERRQIEMNRTLSQPRLVLLVFAVTFAALLLLVIPTFERIYIEFFMALPLPTRLLLWLANNPLVPALGTLVTAGGLFVLSSHPRGDAVRMRLPWIGSLLGLQQSLLWLRWLNALLARGLPLGQAAREATAVCPSPTFRGSMAGVADSIERGGSLGPALLKVRLFPPLTAWMVQQAEAAGCSFEPIAAALEVQGQRSFSRGLPLLEPFLIVSLAVLQLWVVVSLFLPIYQLIGALG